MLEFADAGNTFTCKCLIFVREAKDLKPESFVLHKQTFFLKLHGANS